MHKARKYIIAGNWKMHGTRESVALLLATLKAEITTNDVAEMVVFPPAVFLELTERMLGGSPIEWGAQNVAAEDSGAYTGEVAATMLTEFGCRYVLIGHSERRALYHETNTLLAKKVARASEAGLRPVLCLGETLDERNKSLTQDIICHQLKVIIEHFGGVEILRNAVLAYEPIWAIGTGLTASPEQVQEVHAMLRQQVAEYDPGIAQQLRILYGGSVKAANAGALFSMPDVDGGLVGGASLDAQEFLQIYHSVCNN